MIAKIAKRGTSFKGNGDYLFNDKRLDGETERRTKERIEWAHTRNLATDNPEFAVKIMAYTAIDKDRLKEQAGIKNTGRKSKGDVYHYSLAWHPDEQGKFDKTQMLDAVDQSLKALGAQDYQAVIVAHNDEAHPHVHIVLNLVNPENGKNLNLSNDRKKLDKWAYEYRKSRGEEQTYCPKRTKKMEAIEARKRGESVPYVQGDKNIPRNQFNDLADVRTPTNKNDIKIFLEAQRKKDQILIKDGALMNSRHSHEWDALKDNYKLKKDFIGEQYKKDKAALKDEIYQQNKPLFAEVYRQQWQEKKTFERREKNLAGKLGNVFRVLKSKDMKPSFNVLSEKGRKEYLINQKHGLEISKLKREQGAQTRKAVLDLNDARQAKMSAGRSVFSIEREALIKKQTLDKTQLQKQWKVRNERRKEALQAVKKKEVLRAKEKQNAVHEEELAPLKKEFKRKAEPKRKRKARPRGRSR